jgi:hypothetical protein
MDGGNVAGVPREIKLRDCALWDLTTDRISLRASELPDLRWEQANFAKATLHVRRVIVGVRIGTRYGP